MTAENKTYSIALRMRRIIYEDTYVTVPVTREVLRDEEDGSARIDFEKLVAAATVISQDPAAEWITEEVQVEAHPIQQPTPDDRKSLAGEFPSLD